MNFSKLDAFFKQLPMCGIPGCELAITYKGESVYRAAAGFADAKRTRLSSENDLYYVFSISKISTCVAAMQLVEQGVIALDDPVSKYLPAFAHLTVKSDKSGVVPAQNTMTVLHLFTMTGGLNYNYDAAPILRARMDPNADTLRIVNAMAECPLDFEPGTKYQYSLCHDVLAAVVEVASGVRFADYVQANILDPLGMKDTGYHLPEELLPRMADLYKFRHGVMRADQIEIFNNYIFADRYDSGGAGFYSCTTDQIRLLTVLANGGKTENGYSLLRPETIKMMGINRLPDSARPQFFPSRLYGYGWGLCGRAHENPTVSLSRSAVGEFGWDGAAGAFGLVDPEKQIALYYAMHAKGCQYAYHVIHPTLRNLAYEAIENE
ncbi:MAG: beta-lactamase family protein [Clostridia bacterium]|nr:beta-lactamase family protein [Clostridia bacterium]